MGSCCLTVWGPGVEPCVGGAHEKGKMKKVWDGWDPGCPILGTYLVPLDYTLKNGLNVKFYVVQVNTIKNVENLR